MRPEIRENRREAGALACRTGLLLAGGWMMTVAVAASAAELPAAASFHKDVEPILAKYCYDCHGDGMSKGGVTFDQFASDKAMLENRDLWWTAMRNLRLGVMPPPKKARPTAEERGHIEDWVKASVFGIDVKNPDPGRITIRRLNRVEYRNTIHDLMGIDYNTQIEFPPDDTGYGFDNIGDVLTVSPLLMEKYVTAAKEVIGQAVPTVSRVLPVKIIPGGQFLGASPGTVVRKSADLNANPSFSFYSPAALSNIFEVGIAGDYQVTFLLGVKGNFDYDPGKCRVVLKLDGRELEHEEFGWHDNKAFTREFAEKLAPGPHQATVELEPLTPADKKVNSLDFQITSLTVSGPKDPKFWIKPENYDRYFAGEPPLSRTERRKYARATLESFATKAFRRPVEARTLDRLTALAEATYNEPGKSVEAGIAHAMVAVLASPQFLFRMEDNVKAPTSAAWAPVDEYSLASRLSYFLWSSMPDQELTQLAARGELRKNLTAQVDRMVKDNRSEALVKNFTGQWLQTRDLDAFTVNAAAVFGREAAPPAIAAPIVVASAEVIEAKTDLKAGAGSPAVSGARANGAARNRVPRENANNVAGQKNPRGIQLDADLKKAMKAEAEMVFSTVVREDRSVIDLIESDYTFVNSNLARVYGLTNMDIKGAEMRRITLPPDSPRGGVITEGTVLVITSNPDRTSPVKRGLFVLDHFLGLPVPPPPANIPPLEAAEGAVKDHPATLRESLALHREDPLCSSCHTRMDPIGLGMENFNALGVWRERERGQAIDTAGKLITGESFDSIQELKHILATNHKTDFYRCLTEKMLTYALGRGTECYDAETVDKIVQRMERDQGRFSSLLAGIIDSAPFQEQRLRATPVMAEASEPAAKPDNSQLAKTKESP